AQVRGHPAALRCGLLRRRLVPLCTPAADPPVAAMRAIVVEQTGGPEKLVQRDLPEPVAGPGEVVIDVAYAAANWSDIQKREGVYPDPVQYPAVLGLEVSGHVAAVGRGVRHL